MELRNSIVQVLDDLNADLNINPTPEARLSKLKTWHIALSDVSNQAIERGFIVACKANLKFLPSSGVFRGFCLSSKPAKQYISQSEPDPVPAQDKELNNEHYKMLIEKLKLPEVLKQKEFESFKKNRSTIEANRKLNQQMGK